MPIEIKRDKPTPVREAVASSDGFIIDAPNTITADTHRFGSGEPSVRLTPRRDWHGQYMQLTPEHAREFANAILELADQAEGQS